jgi:WD40 repeat protein
VGTRAGARRLSAIGRAVKWCRRKPASAALVAVSALALIALVAGGVAFGIVQQSLRERAEREADRAREAEKHALEAEQKAKTQFNNSAFMFYVGQVRLARIAWESGDMRRALELLQRWENMPGLEGISPRGWEWYYIKGLCEGKTVLRVPGGKATAVAFRPDGTWLATGDDGGGVQVWEVATGKLIRTLKIHDYNVTALAFHADGKRLAAAGERSGNPGTVKVWDAVSGDEIYTVKGPTKAVRALAFSRDGRFLASGDDDRTVGLWDARTGAPVQSWKVLEGPVRALAFDSSGDRVAAAAGTLVRIWNARREGEPISLRHEQPVSAVSFNASAEVVSLSGARGEHAELSIRAWDADNGTQRRSFLIPAQPWSTLSSDGENVATCGPDFQMAVWSATTGKLAFSSRWYIQPVQALAFSADGSRLACATDDGTVWLGHRFGGQEARGLAERPGPVRALAFHPTGSEFITAGDDGAQFWDPATGKLKRSFDVMNNGKPVPVTAAAYSPDGGLLALAARDRSIRIFDTRDARQVAVLLGHTAAVSSLAFSLDGERLASGSADKTVRLWDVGTGDSIATLEGHSSGVTVVAFGEGGVLASVDSADDGIHVWDIATKSLRGVLKGHNNTVVALAFRPHRAELASGSFDKSIRFWDVKSMTEIKAARLEGHTKVANSIAFTPDGRRLVSAGGDSTVRVWDVITHQELLKLDGGMREVSRVAIAARDARRIICVGHDRIVRIWEAEVGKRPK